MSIRTKRLQELIHKKAATVINRDLSDPRVGLVTVSRVKLAPDLTECKIYWSTLVEGGKRTAVEQALKDAESYVQREIASVMHTRITPRVSFVFDASIEGIDRVNRVLREALDEDRKAAELRGDAEVDHEASPEGGDAEAEPRDDAAS